MFIYQLAALWCIQAVLRTYLPLQRLARPSKEPAFASLILHDRLRQQLANAGSLLGLANPCNGRYTTK